MVIKINLKKPKLKVKKWSQYSKKSKRNMKIALVLAIAMVSIGIIGYFSLFAVGPTTGYATVKVVDLGDDNKDVSDKAKVTVYAVGIGDMELTEIAKLDFNDYKTIVDETTADKINFYIDDNHLYKMRVTYKDSEQWSRPMAGENVVMMVEEASSATLYLEDEDTLNRTYYENTQLDYNLVLVCGDEDEGFMPGFIYDEDEMNYLWICLNFTRAAQESFANIKDYPEESIANSTMLFLGLPGTVYDTGYYELEFGSGKADTYDCNNIGWAFGFEDDISPTWMD